MANYFAYIKLANCVLPLAQVKSLTEEQLTYEPPPNIAIQRHGNVGIRGSTTTANHATTRV